MTTVNQLHDIISLIDQPNRARCFTIWNENRQRFDVAWGSSHNHQAWPGGYLDHIRETMTIACKLYPAMVAHRPLPFSLPDALLVLFLHDLEKPWRVDPVTGEKNPQLVSKAQKTAFRLTLLNQYDIALTPAQANGMRYVEGENDDYTNKRRVMNELAAFCHMCDIASARIWHSQPP